MKITFRNDFHRTEASCRVHGSKLTMRQTKEIRRQLCGHKGCTERRMARETIRGDEANWASKNLGRCTELGKQELWHGSENTASSAVCRR